MTVVVRACCAQLQLLEAVRRGARRNTLGLATSGGQDVRRGGWGEEAGRTVVVDGGGGVGGVGAVASR